MSAQERLLHGVWNLDGGYSVIHESLTVHATQEEADAEVKSRLDQWIDDDYANYGEKVMKAVPARNGNVDPDLVCDGLLHDYAVGLEHEGMTNEDLMRAMHEDFISVSEVFATQEFLLEYFDGDEEAARDLWEIAGGFHLHPNDIGWTQVRTFAPPGSRIIRVWLFVRNIGACCVVTADSQGNNHMAYLRGYFEARSLFDRFAKEAVDSQEPGKASITAS